MLRDMYKLVKQSFIIDRLYTYTYIYIYWLNKEFIREKLTLKMHQQMPFCSSKYTVRNVYQCTVILIMQSVNNVTVI